MPDKWIGAFPALIADIALRAIPVKRRFEIFSKMLLNPDNIGTINTEDHADDRCNESADCRNDKICAPLGSGKCKLYDENT